MTFGSARLRDTFDPLAFDQFLSRFVQLIVSLRWMSVKDTRNRRGQRKVVLDQRASHLASLSGRLIFCLEEERIVPSPASKSISRSHRNNSSHKKTKWLSRHRATFSENSNEYQPFVAFFHMWSLMNTGVRRENVSWVQFNSRTSPELKNSLKRSSERFLHGSRVGGENDEGELGGSSLKPQSFQDGLSRTISY